MPYAQISTWLLSAKALCLEVQLSISPGHSYFWGHLIFRAVSPTGANVDLAIKVVLARLFELLQCHAQYCVCKRFNFVKARWHERKLLGKVKLECLVGASHAEAWDVFEISGWGVNYSSIQVTTSLQSQLLHSCQTAIPVVIETSGRALLSAASRAVNFNCPWIDSLRNAIGAVKDQWAAVSWAALPKRNRNTKFWKELNYCIWFLRGETLSSLTLMLPLHYLLPPIVYQAPSVVLDHHQRGHVTVAYFYYSVVLDMFSGQGFKDYWSSHLTGVLATWIAVLAGSCHNSI